MKKLLVLLMVVVLTFTSGVLVFAEEGESTPLKEERIKEERVQLTREEKGQKVIDLFTMYYPNGLETFEAIKVEHSLFHETAKTEREAYVVEKKAEIQSFRSAFEAEEITQEELKEIMETYKREKETFRAELELIKVDKQAASELIQNDIIALRSALKTALTSEIIDDALVESLLVDLIAYSQKHLDMDYYYYNQVQLLK